MPGLTLPPLTLKRMKKLLQRRCHVNYCKQHRQTHCELRLIPLQNYQPRKLFNAVLMSNSSASVAPPKGGISSKGDTLAYCLVQSLLKNVSLKDFVIELPATIWRLAYCSRLGCTAAHITIRHLGCQNMRAISLCDTAMCGIRCDKPLRYRRTDTGWCGKCETY